MRRTAWLAATMLAVAGACSGNGTLGPRDGAAGTGAAGTRAAGTGAAGTGAAGAPAGDDAAADAGDGAPDVTVEAPAPLDPGAPLELARAPGATSIDLVVVGGYLYWTERDTGTVNRVSTTGGPVTVLARGQPAPVALATDGESIFWANHGDAGGHGKDIMTKALAGGAPAVFVPETKTPANGGPFDDLDDVNGLLVDRGYLYFGRGPEVLKVPTRGGTPMLIARSPDNFGGRPFAFVMLGDLLYQTEGSRNAVSYETTDGTQVGLQVDSKTPEPLAPTSVAWGQGSLVLDAIAAFDGHVIYANGSRILAKDGAKGPYDAPVELATSAGFDTIAGFVISDATIYLAESFEDSVEKLPLATDLNAGMPQTNAKVIAKGQPNAAQFAADETGIYWRTCQAPPGGARPATTDCAIMKLAK